MPIVAKCTRCGGQVVQARPRDTGAVSDFDEEPSCLQCGYRDYGAVTRPTDRERLLWRRWPRGRPGKRYEETHPGRLE